jgi:hypothetical protein
MSQQRSTGVISCVSGGTFAQYARVKYGSGGTITVCGLTEVGIGIAQHQSFASGQDVAVKLFGASEGTFLMIAVEALAVGATLYTEAAGKVQDTAESTSVPFAIALEAATADGDIIECALLPYRGAAV